MLKQYRISWQITRALSIQKRSKFVKNEHARYTLEYFPVDNARYLPENTVGTAMHIADSSIRSVQV
jgi:hypothetical protein